MIRYETTTDDGSILSVRSAGKSMRLYRNGVFHTQWHPERPFDEAVWTLLAISGVLAQRQPKRALLLGVAGGAVLHAWLKLFPNAQLTGVELCPDHLAVGQQWFGLDHPQIDLHCGDAQAWLAAYAGPAFDVIVEDCFDATNPNVERALALDPPWCRLLAQHLAPGGVLAVNAGGLGTLRQSGFVQDAALKKRFSNRSAVHVLDEMNRVGIFVDGADSKLRLRDAIAVWPHVQQRCQLQRLKFNQRRF